MSVAYSLRLFFIRVDVIIYSSLQYHLEFLKKEKVAGLQLWEVRKVQNKDHEIFDQKVLLR